MRKVLHLFLFSIICSLIACTPSVTPSSQQQEQQKPEEQQEKPEEKPEEKPQTPEVVPGKTITVTLAGAEQQLMVNAGESHECEIPFTLSPAVDTVKTEVVTTGFTDVTTDVVFDKDSKVSGKVKISSKDASISSASVSLKVSQKGKYISDNWCTSNTITLKFATLELSTYRREFYSSGNPGARVAVRTNTGSYDCEVPAEYQDWIIILDKNKDGKNNILFSVVANESTEPREGYFMVYDANRQQSAKYTLIQEGKSEGSGHIHDWDPEDADEVIDF